MDAEWSFGNRGRAAGDLGVMANVNDAAIRLGPHGLDNRTAPLHTANMLITLFSAFVFLALFYPLVRVELTTRTAVTTAVLGSWRDVLSCICLASAVRWRLRNRISEDAVSWSVLLILAMGLLSAGITLIIEGWEIGFPAILQGFRLTYLPIAFYFFGKWNDIYPSAIYRRIVLLCVIGSISGYLLAYAVPDYWEKVLIIEGEGHEGGTYNFAREGGYRMTGSLLEAVLFGTTCAIGAILSLNTTGRDGGFARLPKMVTYVALCGLGTLLSLSRGPWITLAIGVVTTLIFSDRQTRIMSLLLLGAISIVLIFAAHGTSKGGSSPLGRTWQMLISDGTNSRTLIWEDAIDRAMEKPFGYGLGRVGHVGYRFQDSLWKSPLITDGWYLKVLCEGGIQLFLAFAVFQTVLISKLFLSIINPAETSSRPYRVAALATFAGVSIQAVVTNIWDYFLVANILWFLAGIGTRKCLPAPPDAPENLLRDPNRMTNSGPSFDVEMGVARKDRTHGQTLTIR